MQSLYSLVPGSDLEFCVRPLCVGNYGMHQCNQKTDDYAHFLFLFHTDKHKQINLLSTIYTLLYIYIPLRTIT